jgi:glutathione-S-conjugate glycine hydrolase
MIRLFSLLFTVTMVTFVASDSAKAQETDRRFLPMNTDLISLNSPEGRKLLRESEGTDEAYWQSTQFYVTQPDLGSCGVASCVTVLNALPIRRPTSPSHGPFPFFTCDNFFTPQVAAVLVPNPSDATRHIEEAMEKVKISGMTLDQLASILRTYPVKATRRYASDEPSSEAFRQTLVETLTRADSFVLVNYDRSVLGQKSSGHISSVGAFHSKSKKVLVLDTANYKYPWTWVPLDQLWHAMRKGTDSESNKSRGYVIVSTKRD